MEYGRDVRKMGEMVDQIIEEGDDFIYVDQETPPLEAVR